MVGKSKRNRECLGPRRFWGLQYVILFTGQKGIGFKSVFTVTDMPEIQSNGFYIKFDAKNETSGVGYILPHWIPAEDRVGDDAVMEELKEINNEQRRV
jgi:hypothetical protein